MIFPEIRSILSPDLDPPNLPADPFDCLITFETIVGPSGSEGAETFRFQVVTPMYMARKADPTWGRGSLIMAAFDWTAVVQSVATLLAGAARPTWAEVVQALERDLELVVEERTH